MAEPVITSAALARGPLSPRIDAPELSDSIVAKPLVMPDFIHVKSANPNVSFRWINYKAGDGLRYSQAQAQGWANATSKDVAPGCLGSYIREGGTKIVNGDLILMKIDRARYLGALKYKHEVASRMSNPHVQLATAAQKAAAGMTVPQSAAGKLELFSPTGEDITNLSVAPGEISRLGNDGPRDMGGSK